MKLLLPAIIAAVSSVALAGPAPMFRPKEPVAADPKIEFTKYTLPNGLEVILAPDPTVPLVAVNIWYHVGSGNETYGKSGFAHLFEHMLFQGSKHVGNDMHFEILKKIGAENVNGTTNTDRTNYFEVVPSNQIETALWLESDRMGFLLDPPSKVADKDKDKYFQDSLSNQIDVVRNERRQSYDNRPYGKALFATFQGLFPEGHPYRYLTIGKHEDLAKASLEDVRDFFRTWYVPANATLSITGDFTVEEGKKLVDKWFGTFPKSVRPHLVVAPMPSITSKEVEVSDEFAKLRQISFNWHTPAMFAEGDAELDVAASALTREGPGRLYKALVYSNKAQSVSANQDSQGFSSVFTITVTLKGDSDMNEIKKIVMDAVTDLGKTPLDGKEINRVVVGQEAQAVRGLETVLGRSQRLQQYNHYLLDPDRTTWDLDRYRTTTPEKIRATVSKYLQSTNVLTVITTPAAKGAK
ncbi:MAG TPA: pitrilysin family protein [Kofleriaceae bacterium]|jgi:predicted Zn-dependent peptidase